MLEVDDKYLIYLERVRWRKKTCCPYCKSDRATPYKHERRYHCHDCFSSYSVLVGTLFQQTHIPLEKWFQAIFTLNQPNQALSSRKLATKIGVSKNTAMSMIKRIRQAKEDTPELINKIAQIKDINDLISDHLHSNEEE